MAGPRRRLLRPATIAIAGLLAIAALAYGISGAIEDYHDRVALRGLNGRPAPIAIAVAGESLVIPANMIRFRTARRGGDLDRVDLLLHWPSLDGFTEGRAEAFKDASPDAPLVFATIAEQENTLDSTARLERIYSRFFEGKPIKGPAGLTGRRLAPDSPYAGDIVYFSTDGGGAFVARCVAEPTAEIPATCLRDINFGDRLSLFYRFNQAYLKDWQSMDGRLKMLAEGFLAKR